VRVRENVLQTVEDAGENLKAALELAAPGPCGLLLDLRDAEPLEVRVRHCYRGAALQGQFDAMAILVKIGPFGKMMGNIYLRSANLGFPAKLFNQEERAIHWIYSIRAD
jgi:hypothetical protein